MGAREQREQRRRRALRARHLDGATGTIATRRDRREDVIGADPDLRNYLRAPYDPLYQAQATRFFSQGLLHAAASGGRTRIGVLVVALGAMAGMVVGVGVALNAALTREGLWGAAVIWSLFFAAAAGLFGITLLRRLLRIPAR
jgi:hypothetical protein